jgi:hypothetical protein
MKNSFGFADPSCNVSIDLFYRTVTKVIERLLEVRWQIPVDL